MVFHDIPADNFNIDHVVIAREGVFAVETKGFTKPKQGAGRADATVFFDGSSLRYPQWTTKKAARAGRAPGELGREMAECGNRNIRVSAARVGSPWLVCRALRTR